MMNNFASDIEEVVGDESIEAIVVGSTRGWDPKDHPTPGIEAWKDARPRLDYEYNTGFGGQDCHSIYAWTATRILFVGTYDGSTWIQSLPRNPIAGEPTSVGGE